MDYTYLAIDMLNQYLEEIINVEDTVWRRLSRSR